MRLAALEPPRAAIILNAGVSMSPTADNSAPTPDRKQTEIRDLPSKDENDEAAGDVKGGASTDPVARRNPGLRAIDPCWRPGGAV